MFGFASQTKIAVVLAALSTLASATAIPRPVGPSGSTGGNKLASALGSKCSVASATPSLPAGQTNVTVPSGTPFMVALGVGVQNYTCASTGAYR